MKENEFLFSQDNEDSVSKFWNFGDHKHLGPEATHTVSLNEAIQKFVFLFSLSESLPTLEHKGSGKCRELRR